MKSVTLIFYGSDSIGAKELAGKVRAESGTALLRHAPAFRNDEIELCDRVVVLSCVEAAERLRISTAYGDKVVTAGAAVPPPPPPPGPVVDPLDSLPSNWPQLEPIRLREIAAAISGRSVENKQQAVQVIEAALKARRAK